MDRILIEGGTPLEGTVHISGAKNAALPDLMACLLAQGISTVSNLPDLHDIDTLCQLLEGLGAEVTRENNHATVDCSNIHTHEAPYDLVRKMRASVLVLGPLLARFGHARVSLPGGCAIGQRPIDQHLKGLEAMGATIDLNDGYVQATAPSGLQGARIVFDMPSVGATENLLMAASLAKGESIIENAAREPEITDLASCLRSMGAQIEGEGQSIIRVQGVPELNPARHHVLPDRIEAGTYMAAAAITGGNVLLEGAVLEHLDAVVVKMTAAGVEVRREADGIRVRHHGELHGVHIETRPFPGFPTDLQAQFMTLMTLAKGASMVTENVFENRFMHVPELRRLGASIQVQGRSALVTGVGQLAGAQVMASDLRASAALVIAGLAAHGTTEILRVYHLDRGYEHIERKLGALGASIRRGSETTDAA